MVHDSEDAGRVFATSRNFYAKNSEGKIRQFLTLTKTLAKTDNYKTMNQNLTCLTVLFLLFLTVDANAQKTVAELPPAHASALQQLLTKHDGLEFLSETVCDQTILKD